MASTFELSSQYYGTRHLRLACSQTTDIATNTSTIAWTLYSEGGSSDYYTTGPTTVKINGTTVYYKDTVYYNEGIFPAKKGSVSGTTTVQHDNDGTKSITVSLTTAIYYSSTETKSGTWTLDSIPRYATLSTSISSRTETAVTMSWTADATCDRLYYSTNNGSTFTQVNIADSTSGTYTITGLSAGTRYYIKTKVRRKDSQLETISTAVETTTYMFPYATTMPDFTIGNEVQITIYNPLGRSCSVKLQTHAGTDNGAITTTGTTVKGWAGSSNISTWYASIPNATSANYKVVVTYGSHSSTSNGGKYSINTTACTPTIGSVTYQDTNTASVNVTQDNQKIVQNQSVVRYTASSLSAKNSATISSVKVVVNGSTYNMTVSGTTATGGNATINSSSNVTATVTITDSRGLTGTKSVTVSMYEWKLPTGIITMQRQNNYYTPTSIKCDAQFSYLGGHNTISITYACTKDGDSSASITGTLQDNVASTVNLDNQYGWSVRYTLMDAFGTTTYTVRLERGQPIVYFDRLKTSVGFGTFPVGNKTVEVADDWQIYTKSHYNRMEYLPYSFDTAGVDGTNGYARIVRITMKPTVGTFASMPMRFEVARRYDFRTVNIYLKLTHVNSTTPEIDTFYYDGDNSGVAYNNFSAFAYKVSDGVFDIYVSKTTEWGWIDVWSYISPFMAYRANFTYESAILASAPSNAVMASQLPIFNTAKDNKFSYMPYSFAFDTDPATNTATTGFHRIATITITGNMQRESIQFVVSRKYDLKPVTLSLLFINEGTTDPTSASLYYDSLDGTNTGNGVFTAFAYRTGTSSWDVYVHKSASQDKITVTTYVPYYIQSVATITYAFKKIDSVPSGAVMATPVPPPALGSGTVQSIKFNIAGNTSKTIRGSSECAWLISCTGWSTYTRAGLWFIAGYSDSSRADITTIKQLNGITITPVSGSLAWTIANTQGTTADITVLAMWGQLPTVS